MSKQCNNCGVENDNNSKFCEKCGKRLSGEDNINTNKKRKKLLIGVVVVLAIVITIVGGVLLSGINSNHFPTAVEVGGMVFHIPDGFELTNSSYDASNSLYQHTYRNASSKIAFSVVKNPYEDLSYTKNYFEEGGTKTQNVTIGGYSGFMISNTPASLFVYEKDGATIFISISRVPSNDIEKIIG